MSVSNPTDAELRELVAKTLEEKGVLGKVKAQLRASVFLALQDYDSSTKFPLNNDKVRNFLSSQEGKLATSLVIEFLDFFELESSKAVFETESSCGSLCKGRKSLLEDIPALNESDTTSGPLLSAVIKRLTSSKLPNIPTTQNLNEKYPKYLTKSDEFVPKTDPVSSVFNGDSVFAHGKALGGLKEDFSKADILGNDSVRRILDFDKTSTSFPPVSDKRLTSGTSETSTATNVQRSTEAQQTKASEPSKLLDTGRKEELMDTKLLGTHPPNPAVNTLPTHLLKDGSTNDYDEDFSSEDDGSIHTSSVSSEHSDDMESQATSTNKLETTDHTINLSQSTEYDITETINNT